MPSDDLKTPRFTVFGYGSLIFKPPPHVISQVPGFLKGYVRRFAQSSHDHRGTPENPGRVVTLIHKEDWDAFAGATDPFPENIVWGIAYTIDPVYETEVREYLDHREKDGYTMETIDIWGVVDGEEKVILPGAHCYVGRSDNPSFVGFEPIEGLAYHIWKSEGPSGRNKDYLYNLSKAIRKLAPESHDEHLAALELRIRRLDEEAEEEGKKDGELELGGLSNGVAH
ncbi:ChaC-like protein [Pterulicium gracile]|uniref:glutathione-specific gamma-glutamylcyclotransferase n=1 Tax=Pterulicium gracile TaxID=1884261 RepID=A0A5C3Q7L8_9AGAR|nr:ChaC-like protein [Pterula gracilis]